MNEVEELKSLFKKQSQGALSLNIAFIGVVNSLFSTLARIAPASSRILARETSMDPGYVARWCDAAYAFGYLEDDKTGTFRLSPTGEAMCPRIP